MSEEQTMDPQIESPSADEVVEAESSEAAGEEASPTGTSTGDNWWDTSGLDDKTAKRIKSIEAEYTRKSQAAAKAEQYERELSQYQHQLTEYQRALQQGFENPELYQNARKQYLASKGITEPSEPPKLGEINTREDLEEYIQKATEWRLAQERAQFNQQIQQVAAPLAKQRWEAAINSVSSRYPKDVWNKHFSQAASTVAQTYNHLSSSLGLNEEQALEREFRALAALDLVEAAKREAKVAQAKSVETKKQAFTEKPGRGITTSSSKPKTKEEALAELRSQGLSFER